MENADPQCRCIENSGFPHYYTGACHKNPDKKIFGVSVPQVPLVDWQLACPTKDIIVKEGFGNLAMKGGIPMFLCLVLLLIVVWFLYQKYGQQYMQRYV